MKKQAMLTASAAIAMALGGCASTKISPAGPVSALSNPELGQSGFALQVEQDYKLRPSDVLSVSVFREEGLSLAEVPVTADGLISVPLVGPIRVAGMTPMQVERGIEQALKSRYLRNPHVTVNVMKYASHQVTVEGAVKSPGLFNFLPGTRLSGSIALAEGLDRVADSREVAVFRQTAEGMQVAKFDYAAMQQGLMVDPVLQPGDRVVVGTSGLSQFWQDLLKALPAFALFTAI